MNKVFVVINVQDMSDRRRMERDLRQAQKMEAIGTLAGGIAHDFNNILSAIFGYAELAGMDIDDHEKLKDDLNEVSRAAERAKDLVKQILTFSRRTEFEKSPLQMSLIVKEALKLLRSSIPVSIEIIQNIQSDAVVLADPTQIHQIIMNLCTNAYHAMRDTGGTLTLSLTEVEVDETSTALYPSGEATGSYLKLTVSDTGHGMDRDTMDSIFEPYFTTKDVDEGTGLGLAVVHGIVTQSNGIIRVESEPGKGTSFHIFMPVLRQKPNDAPLVKADQMGLQGGTGTIMFVDDEEAIRRLGRNILEKYGYQIRLFSNGYEAWQEYKNHPDHYDLIITDMTMPQMGGYELAENILRESPDMPIILCTGHNEKMNREKALAMGITEFILKPIEISELAHTVKTILTGKRHGV